MLCQLLGKEHTRLNVRVDSNQGAYESEFDFNLKSQGNAFDVQNNIFNGSL